MRSRPRRPASSASRVGGKDSGSPPSSAYASEVLDVERVSLRPRDDSGAERRLDFGRHRREQRLCVDVVERSEPQRGGRPRSSLEQLGTREADHEHRCMLDALAQVVDQIEKRRLGPVNVVEDEHQRALPSTLLEEAAHGEKLLAGRVRAGEEGGEPAAERGDHLLERSGTLRPGRTTRSTR